MPEWVGDDSEWKTDNFGLQVLRDSDISEDNYAFSDADRVIIDKLLWQIFAHHHSGVDRLTNPMNDATPSITLSLNDSATGGNIQAGLLMCYRVSFYDSSGETTASEEQTIEMPDPVDEPGAPTLTVSTTGGTLTSGSYFYSLSAVKGNGETLTGESSAVVVGTATSTNKITVTFPSAPSGATHWNIYKKTDTGDFYFLKQVAVAASSYDDDGSDSIDTDISPPLSNTTNSENKVTLTLSGVPAGATGYYIYRTIVSGDYPAYSLLVDQEIGATPVLEQEDIGDSLEYGVPLEAASTYGSPPKVDLDSAADVSGTLPTANISPLDDNLNFNNNYGINMANWVSSSLAFVVTDNLWDDSLATPTIKSCNITLQPYVDLTIQEVRAHVKTAPQGDPTPTSSGVRIDIKVNGTSIFAGDGDKPLIANGNNNDTTTTIDTTSLSKDDEVTMVIDTIDDTHSAADLEVFVRCKQSLNET